MQQITDFFSIHHIAFRILEYDLSWVELLATAFTLVNVYLAIRQHILNWPFALIAIILSFVLFFQSALYADAFLQIYFFIVSAYGWWHWSKGSLLKDHLPVTTLSVRARLFTILIIVILTPLSAFCMVRLPVWMPEIFTQPTAYPLPDSFIMITSFTGQWLIARKKIENWHCWIAVNAVAVVIYYLKDIRLFSILYLLLLLMAIAGLRAWNKRPA
jgi:nicotinamide mononucleotide transporter